jgi:hypothetical protein
MSWATALPNTVLHSARHAGNGVVCEVACLATTPRSSSKVVGGCGKSSMNFPIASHTFSMGDKSGNRGHGNNSVYSCSKTTKEDRAICGRALSCWKMHSSMFLSLMYRWGWAVPRINSNRDLP